MVPGNLPIGCSAMYLTFFKNSKKAFYDETNGCLKAFNTFAEYHNSALKRALWFLKLKYPHARIMYADYFEAAMPMFVAPQRNGEISSILHFFVFHLSLIGCLLGPTFFRLINFSPASTCISILPLTSFDPISLTLTSNNYCPYFYR